MTASLDTVRSAVALVCGVEPATLDASTRLTALGADSLALVSIADVVEADLHAAGVSLAIDDASLGRMTTLGEIVAYVDAHRAELARTWERIVGGKASGLGEDIAGLIDTLGGDVDRDGLDLAVTHRSFAYENGGVPTNERLEFLGDSVLGVIITEELYRRFPELPEGQLAKLRAAVVNARALAEVGRTIEIGRYLKLGRGEETSGGRDKSSILADALEAVIGAYYLDRGVEPTRTLVLGLFAAALEGAATLGAGLDWKTSLQELAAERSLGAPEYVVVESGPDHAKAFHATAVVGGDGIGEGTGRSKKEAEQRAAEQAWTALNSEGAELSAGTATT